VQHGRTAAQRGAKRSYEIITRAGVDPTTAPGKPSLPPIDHVRLEIDGLCVDRNMPVRLRDGTTIYVDLFRPQSMSSGLPVLLAWGPYGKHFRSSRLWPGADVEDGWISELTGFESPDPVYWCGHGYAVAYADPRGLWRSEGTYPHNGPQEAEDVYDTIEWLGAAEWSNGRVGMLGISYLAGVQYLAAIANPPSLKASVPGNASQTGIGSWPTTAESRRPASCRGCRAMSATRCIARRTRTPTSQRTR
jgi:putative CocE/NonD family hydrolase